MKSKFIIALLLLIGAAALVAWFVLSRKPSATLGEQRLAKAPAQGTTVGYKPTIRLDQTAQEESGLQAIPLNLVSSQLQTRIYGVVISPSNLVELRQACVAAAAQAQKAQSALKFAEEDYQRTKLLYDKGENASQKAFQLAAGVLREDQATVEATRQALEAAQEDTRQRWGAVIAGWVIEGAPEFGRLMKQEQLLMQLTSPFGSRPFVPPPEATVQTADGSMVPVRFVSTSPSTEVRLQGQSYYYVATSQGTTLLPGMNIVAFLPMGEPVEGVVVPYSAVVWLRGFAWAYFCRGTTEFVRQRISTEQPLQNGWFEPNTTLTNQMVVVQGAQVLLSEELLQTAKAGRE